MPSLAKRWLLAATVAGLLVLAGAAPALAAERFAEPGGNGPALTCPQADPCDIQTATEGAAVNNGDVITLLPGTYSIGTNTLQPSDTVTIRSLPGQPRPLVIAGTTYAFRFSGTLRRVAIEQGPGVGAALEVWGTVENVFAHSDSPFHACQITNGTIRDSVCWNSGSGWAIYAPGPISPAEYTSRLRNVTAFAQGGPAIEVSAGGGSNTVEATNVIAYGTPYDIEAQAFASGQAATLVADHSNYLYENEVGAGTAFVTNPGTNRNQTAPPLFVNSADGDFHQRADSPTVNAGSAAAGLGSTDIDGEARQQGPAPDIGADEFPESAAVDTTAPETTIMTAPRRRVKTRKHRIRATFRFIADDPAATFECILDGVSYPSCTSPFRKRVRRGRHRFEVLATDTAGNVEAEGDLMRWRVKRKR